MSKRYITIEGDGPKYNIEITKENAADYGLIFEDDTQLVENVSKQEPMPLPTMNFEPRNKTIDAAKSKQIINASKQEPMPLPKMIFKKNK